MALQFNPKRSNMSFAAAKKIMGAQTLNYAKVANVNKNVDAEGKVLPDYIFLIMVDEDGVESRVGNVSKKIRTELNGASPEEAVAALRKKKLVVSELIDEDGSSTFSIHEESANKAQLFSVEG